jgi:hypothetical protein
MVSCLEAVNHPTLYLTSILNVYEVFEHHHMLWMGIWVYPYKFTPMQVVGASFEKCGKGRVQVTSWCHVWRL